MIRDRRYNNSDPKSRPKTNHNVKSKGTFFWNELITRTTGREKEDSLNVNRRMKPMSVVRGYWGREVGDGEVVSKEVLLREQVSFVVESDEDP